MAFEPEALKDAVVSQWPFLLIRDNVKFFKAWPKMEASVNFFLRWRGIIDDPRKIWLTDFLHIFEAYNEPNNNFDDPDRIEFILPNFIRSSKELSAWVFPLGSCAEDAEDIIMFCK